MGAPITRAAASPSNQAPTVAVIVVAYNSSSDIKRCLRSLKGETAEPPLQLEAWVIDNSSEEESKPAIRQATAKYPWAHYRDAQKNLGFAAGNNLGLKLAAKAGADYFFLLNADAAVEPGCVSTLLQACWRTGADAVGPLMLYEDGTVYYAGGEFQPWLGATFHPGRKQRPAANLTEKPVNFINGCGLFFPAATYERWGGLPEDYFMYYEEADWCAHLAADSGLLLFIPQAKLIHYTGKSSSKSAPALYYLTRNQWLFARRYTKWYHRLTAYPAIAAFQLLRYLKYLDHDLLVRAIKAAWHDALENHYGQRTII